MPSTEAKPYVLAMFKSSPKLALSVFTEASILRFAVAYCTSVKAIASLVDPLVTLIVFDTIESGDKVKSISGMATACLIWPPLAERFCARIEPFNCGAFAAPLAVTSKLNWPATL